MDNLIFLVPLTAFVGSAIGGFHLRKSGATSWLWMLGCGGMTADAALLGELPASAAEDSFSLWPVRRRAGDRVRARQRRAPPVAGGTAAA